MLLVLLCTLAWALVPKALGDVVTTPLRHFGLGELRGAALSPDAQLMATFGQSGAFIWDYNTGQMKHRLEGHRAPVTAATFSSDSRLLFTAGNDLQIRSWDVDSGRLLRTLSGHIRPIITLSVSTDGQWLLSGSEDNTARLWDLTSGQVWRTFTVRGSFLQQALFASNNACVVTLDLSITNGVRIWDTASGSLVRQFDTNANGATALILLPDERAVTTGSDKLVRIWDLNSGRVLKTLAGGPASVSSLAFSSADQAIIASGDGNLFAWDYPAGTLRHQYQTESAYGALATVSAGQVLTSHFDNVVRVKTLATGATIRQFEGHTSSTTTGVAFSPDKSVVVSSGVEAATRLWRRTNAEPIRTLAGHPSGSSTVLFSPRGELVLTTLDFPYHAAQLWEWATGQATRELLGHTGYLLAADFSKDGSRIVTGSTDSTVRLWNTNGTLLRTFTSPDAWMRSVAISPNGSLVAGGGSDWAARLWDAQTGVLLYSFPLDAGPVEAVRFSPDGKALLVAWQEGVIEVYGVPGGKLVRTMVPTAAFIESAEYSPDGRFILVGQGWPTFSASLLDANTGELLRTFAGHTAAVGAVAFNATSTMVLTGADHVRLWTIADIAARLKMRNARDALELQWNTGVLQHSEFADGGWVDLPEATSPWTVQTAGPTRFFRVRALAED